jgi:hypothetical protein
MTTPTPSTDNTASAKPATTAAALSDAERTRLSRKSVNDQVVGMEKALGRQLMAWYIIALNVQRSQVAADRAGAMMAVTQRQSNDAERAATSESHTHQPARVARAAVAPTNARPTSVAAAAPVRIKQEPVDPQAQGPPPPPPTTVPIDDDELVI